MNSTIFDVPLWAIGGMFICAVTIVIVFAVAGVLVWARQRNDDIYEHLKKVEKQNSQIKSVIARNGGMLDRLEKLEDAILIDQINPEETENVYED